MHGLSNSGGRQLAVNGKSLHSHKVNEQPLHSPKVRFTKEDKQPLHSLNVDKKLLDSLQADNKPLCSPNEEGQLLHFLQADNKPFHSLQQLLILSRKITNHSVLSRKRDSCYILSRQT